MVMRALAVTFALVALACGDDDDCCTVTETNPPPPDSTDGDADSANGDGDILTPFAALPDATALPGPAIRFSHARAAFFDAPVPALDLFDAAGHPRLDAFPRDAGGFVDGLAHLAEGTDGASLAGAVYFAFDREPPGDRALSGAVIDVDPSSPERGRVFHPTLTYEADGGPHGAPWLVSLYPTQGLALRPKTRYLALVSAPDALGAGAPVPSFGRSAELADLLAGRDVPALGAYAADYRAALEAALALAPDDVAPARLLGLTVFTTADPVSELAAFVTAARADFRPSGDPDAAAPSFALIETYDRYCVYRADITLPDYQHGELPFATPGEGTWRRDDAGRPELARRAPSRLFLTVPRAPAPAAGFPIVVFIRTGGGGDRPLVDRGPRAVAHGEPIVPSGTGPAMNLAAAGWAGIQWDGPHGGARNPTGGDEQFLMFNVTNPAGTRDNIRQTALEAVLLRDLVADLRVDASGCPGASGADGVVTFDDAHTAIMGHSMGGWIAPIAMANSGKFETAILSGAGGSWSANIVYKKSPLNVRPLAEQLLGYAAIGRELRPADPALTLLQWAGEAADPQSYGAAIAAHPRNILMIEGIVDTYILPPIANTTALTLRLDLASPAYDETDPRLAAFVPLRAEMTDDMTQLAAPVTGNRGAHTAVIVQAPGDELEDGHEAMFQTPGPKHQYRCFLATLAAAGTPTLVAPGAEWDACPGLQ